MLPLVVQTLRSAIRLTIKRDGRKWNEKIIAHQDDIGPLMPDDIAVAMMECLGVFRMQTGAMVKKQWHFIIAFGKTRRVKSETLYRTTPCASS